ncbi:MAG: hypothetical protein WAN65_01955 [Candidatus Sulfotelmatobacter sp.]
MTPAAPRRIKLPGFSWKKKANENEVLFLKGRIRSSGWGQLGSGVQVIETDSKLQPIVKLVGDTYAYFCPNCQRTVWEQELIQRGGHRSASITGQVCLCGARISPLQPGDKVRVHYRFHPEGKWGAWWAERWEW